jgi:hypothetical protein
MGKFVKQNEENCDTAKEKNNQKRRDSEIFMRCSLHIYDFLVHFLILFFAHRVIAYFLSNEIIDFA